ncbi:hypothetical protein DYB32_005117 [Aphanomyces invadans]|uniref:DDE-1 domain-containing protein n=1 Tax=Aphanomyces invadans TaxID=157072 RepID=A0A3R6ZQ07_9STRA|nr:hypothetical protein DYB32_005117 [Aphanomyces invadans]
MPGPSKRLTLHQKQVIREYYKKITPANMSLLRPWVVEQFGFAPHRTTLLRLVKDTRQWNFIATKTAETRRNILPPRYPELEQQLYIWIKRANDRHCCLTGSIILRKAQQLAENMSLDVSSARPRAFGNIDLTEMSFLYRSNRKAWMTIALFGDWIRDLNDDMSHRNKSILLLLDNASSHKTIDVELTNVRVLLLPPNTTSVLQPLDAGIIAALKRHYQRRQLDYVISRLDSESPHLAALSENLYAVDLLTAIRWLDDSWSAVSPKVIQNCWNHTGVLPEKSLSSQLGALRLRLMASIRDFLN